MLSATASGIGRLEVAGRGRSNFREWERPTPREKALFQNKARTGWQRSKPRHRNGPFDWVTIHIPIWITDATAACRGALTFALHWRVLGKNTDPS
jgi:hypothetical protein